MHGTARGRRTRSDPALVDGSATARLRSRNAAGGGAGGRGPQAAPAILITHDIRTTPLRGLAVAPVGRFVRAAPPVRAAVEQARMRTGIDTSVRSLHPVRAGDRLALAGATTSASSRRLTATTPCCTTSATDRAHALRHRYRAVVCADFEAMRAAAYDIVLLEETFGDSVDHGLDHLNLTTFAACWAELRAARRGHVLDRRGRHPPRAPQPTGPELPAGWRTGARAWSDGGSPVSWRLDRQVASRPSPAGPPPGWGPFGQVRGGGASLRRRAARHLRRDEHRRRPATRSGSARVRHASSPPTEALVTVETLDLAALLREAADPCSSTA